MPAGYLNPTTLQAWLRWGVALNNGITAALIYLRSNMQGGATTAETQSTFLIPAAGTITRLIGRNQVATTADVTYTLRVNGVDTGLALVIPAASVALLSAATPIAVAAGDLVSLRADSGGASINAFVNLSAFYLPT